MANNVFFDVFYAPCHLEGLFKRMIAAVGVGVNIYSFKTFTLSLFIHIEISLHLWCVATVTKNRKQREASFWNKPKSKLHFWAGLCLKCHSFSESERLKSEYLHSDYKSIKVWLQNLLQKHHIFKSSSVSKSSDDSSLYIHCCSANRKY